MNSKIGQSTFDEGWNLMSGALNQYTSKNAKEIFQRVVNEKYIRGEDFTEACRELSLGGSFPKLGQFLSACYAARRKRALDAGNTVERKFLCRHCNDGYVHYFSASEFADQRGVVRVGLCSHCRPGSKGIPNINPAKVALAFPHGRTEDFYPQEQAKKMMCDLVSDIVGKPKIDSERERRRKQSLEREAMRDAAFDPEIPF